MFSGWVKMDIKDTKLYDTSKAVYGKIIDVLRCILKKTENPVETSTLRN